jgi:hypothetical protein
MGHVFMETLKKSQTFIIIDLHSMICFLFSWIRPPMGGIQTVCCCISLFLRRFIHWSRSYCCQMIFLRAPKPRLSSWCDSVSHQAMACKKKVTHRNNVVCYGLLVLHFLTMYLPSSWMFLGCSEMDPLSVLLPTSFLAYLLTSISAWIFPRHLVTEHDSIFVSCWLFLSAVLG